MIHKKSIFLSFVGIFLVLALIAIAGVMGFHAGQVQGYALGGASNGGQSQVQAPLPAQIHPYEMMPIYYFPFGIFFAIIPMIVIFCLIGCIFRFFLWGCTGRRYSRWADAPFMHHHGWMYDQPDNPYEKEQPQSPSGQEQKGPDSK